jgi:UDP-N-acetylmuramyl pentapeptide phosphotransferase/UDP-N-acetylglucosamine-1-phosphate transferase
MLDLSAAIIGFGAGVFAALLLVATQPWHRRLTVDPQRGVQKLHKVPTPRVGGLVVLSGALAGGLALPSMGISSGGAAEPALGLSLWGPSFMVQSSLVQSSLVQSSLGPSFLGLSLWGLVALGALPAFLAGLLEDLTKRVSVRLRLLATCLSGLLFAQLSGYRITAVDIPGLDWLLGFWLPSVLLTAVAVGGIANAVNLIDGVNGLAAGTAIIIFAAFAVIAFRLEDLPLLLMCLVVIGALASFLLLNFPMAYLFLGDAGAYTVGYLLAVVAVMLPARNPSLSPLVGLLALSYPVIETMVSVHRRWARQSGGHRARLGLSMRPGRHPGARFSLRPAGRIGQPDRLHLHSLVYRDCARRLALALGAPQLRNALAGVLLWPLPLVSAGLTILFCDNSALMVLGLGLMLWLYLRLYRRVALLGPSRLVPQRGPKLA